MTELEINNLQAGVETNQLIAEHLFGWHKFQTSNTKFDAIMNPCCDICGRTETFYYAAVRPITHLGVQHPSPYSSMRHAAWWIVDLMLKDGWALSELSSDNGSYWSIIWEKLPRTDFVVITANADTDCLAICKAGLKWKLGITF